MIIDQDDVIEISSRLNNSQIAIVRTDTLYGVVARADNERAVERVYSLKSRTETKSPIVLIANSQQMFDPLVEKVRSLVTPAWPEKTSIIMPTINAPIWIQRGNKSVAYRLPQNEWLRQVLEKTGPLIAPSANPEGQLPAMNIEEAKSYFGEKVDFYVDGGEVTVSEPSKILRVDEFGDIERIR